MKTKFNVLTVTLVLILTIACSNNDDTQKPLLEDETIEILNGPTSDVLLSFDDVDVDGNQITYAIESQTPDGATLVKFSNLLVANATAFNVSDGNKTVVVTIKATTASVSNTAVITFNIINTN